MKARDLSVAQFLAALRKHGIVPDKFSPFGYCDVGNGVHVSRFNGGDRLRGQLAYLVAEQRRAERAARARVAAKAGA